MSPRQAQSRQHSGIFYEIGNGTDHKMLLSLPVTTETLRSSDLTKRLSPRLVSSFFFALAAILGLLDALAVRHAMGSDGISYLDMSDVFRSGHWLAAINAYWSPLYPIVLAIAFRIVKPSPYWEFAVLHFTNFVIYLGAFAAFGFFLKGFLRYVRLETHDDRLAVSESLWTALGYTIFMWASLRTIRIYSVTPDMLASAFAYLAAGFILRIKTGAATWKNYALLGAALGLGYLAKTPMFPLGLAFLAVSVLVAGKRGNWLRAAGHGLVACGVFLAICSPMLYLISKSQGHLSFGDSGSLNYSFYENRLPKFFWVTDSNSLPTRQYPARELFVHPAVYQFTLSQPLRGTYPYWYDPAAWYKGVHPVVDLKANWRFLSSNFSVYYAAFRYFPAIPIALLILLGWRARRPGLVRAIGRQWFLLAVPLCGLTMFALVYVESRHVGAMFALLLMGLFAALVAADSEQSRKVISIVTAGLIVSLMLQLSAASLKSVHAADWRDFGKGTPQASSNPAWSVAYALHQAGIEPGDKVAWLRPQRFTKNYNYYWARVARVQIAAEIPDSKEFWAADDATRNSAIRTLSTTVVKALVMSEVPASARIQDLTPLGSTGYYIYFFNR